MAKLFSFWISLRSSLWFVPSIMVAAAIALAATLVELEGTVSQELLANYPRLFGAGAEGARGMLGTIAASIATVAGVAFSITIVALSLASSQYTPRILRNFIRDRATQIVLGAFVGIFVYCLLVQRTIRGEDDGDFVPSLAVAFALLLALVGVGCFIFFIHHIAASIQASNIISSVACEAIQTVKNVYPEELTESSNEDKGEDAFTRIANDKWQEIPSQSTGYIQTVDLDALVEVATRGATVIKMECGIGEFIVQGRTLALIRGERCPDEATVRQISRAYEVNRFRTIEQDPAFGISQLVDIALKALSPSMNDTTTATTSIDYISAICSEIARRRILTPYLYEKSELRVVMRGPTFEDLLDLAFNRIRESAKGNTAVILRMLEALRLIAQQSKRPKRLRHIAAHEARIKELADRSIESEYDRARIEDAIERVDLSGEHLHARPYAG